MKIEEMARKALYFGIGLAFYSKEKIEKLVKEMVETGEIRQKEAKDFKEELIKRAEKEKKEFVSTVQNEVKKVVKALGLATKDDLKQLEKKIAKLESQSK